MYSEDNYNSYREEAENALRNELVRLLQQGSYDAILDLSFAFQESRAEWKSIVEESGGQWVLVFLDVGVDELRRRVRERNQLAVKDGDSAFFFCNKWDPQSFIAGFERPIGKGELISRLDHELGMAIDV